MVNTSLVSDLRFQPGRGMPNAEEILKRLDTNNDGKITAEELVTKIAPETDNLLQKAS
jgi:Ca2+-binding EF-hand superfamily protein